MRKYLRLFMLCLFGVFNMASWAQEICPNNEIWYTSRDGKIVEPNTWAKFGASIIRNTYSDDKGIIRFDGDVTSIGENAFKECWGLTSINIPNSVTNIGDYAFQNCASLTAINIPNSVTNIGGYAFLDCERLTSINLPNSVTNIGKRAFQNCYRISKIFIVNPNPPFIDKEDFIPEEIHKYAIIHIPYGSYEDYSSSYGWRNFMRFKEDLDIDGTTFYNILTVKQGEYGYVQHFVKTDSEYKLGIIETNNAKVNTITFNGEDMTDKLSNGIFTTPIIKSNSTLSVSFNITPNSVKAEFISNVKVYTTEDAIVVNGAKVNDSVNVYSTDGKLVESSFGEGKISVGKDGIYIVKVGNETFKVCL